MNYETVEHDLSQLLGDIGAGERYHYALLLDAWKTYLKANDDIETNGITINTGQRLFVNPACNVRNEAHKQIIKLLKYFGIQPLNRSEMDTADDEEMRELIEG